MPPAPSDPQSAPPRRYAPAAFCLGVLALALRAATWLASWELARFRPSSVVGTALDLLTVAVALACVGFAANAATRGERGYRYAFAWIFGVVAALLPPALAQPPLLPFF